VKVPGRVTSPGRSPGKDARQSQKIRPILIVLVLFVLISAAVWAALFLASSTTKNDVRRLVQTQCKLASTSFAGDVSIEGEGIGGTARIPYVDSTGSHTAIVRLGADGTYSLDTCGR
jgi:hypothetical protein